jgi:L-ribulose-5-phosphate 4-epimerase
MRFSLDNDTEWRKRVAECNRKLPEAGLVTAHSGNVSGLDRKGGRLYIKPSGFDYGLIDGNRVVAIDFSSGEPFANQLKPSVDLAQHMFLYRHMPEIGGVIHTHSNYATAFAAVGRSIPCALTAIADEFGGDIPCAPYVDNLGDNIGNAILEHRGRGPAILLGNHGVFTWGETPEAALKAAIMVEDVAKTLWLAMQIGQVHPLPAEEVAKWWDRYQGRYGQ